MAEKDFTQRFMFENTDVRGEFVSLEQSYQHILAKHPYPRPVAILLGELAAAAALLVDTIKFDGLLILQARSNGSVPLLMVECSSERQLRAIARYDAEAINEQHGCLRELMPEGVLTITVDPKEGQRYQGLVSLDGDSLAQCFSNYFATSEQLASQFWLQADGTKARGFMLQQLPAERIKDASERANSWEHVVTLADTISNEELQALDIETILYRLYHEQEVRLFNPAPVEFQCSCSRERSANALVSLGHEDVLALLKEKSGTIEIDCQFCNERYLFTEQDVEQLFRADESVSGQTIVH